MLCGLRLTVTAVGDYYFVKAANDLVSLGVINCDGNLTGSNETLSASGSPPSPTASSPAPTGSANASSGTQVTTMRFSFMAAVIGLVALVL